MEEKDEESIEKIPDVNVIPHIFLVLSVATVGRENKICISADSSFADSN